MSSNTTANNTSTSGEDSTNTTSDPWNDPTYDHGSHVSGVPTNNKDVNNVASAEPKPTKDEPSDTHGTHTAAGTGRKPNQDSSSSCNASEEENNDEETPWDPPVFHTNHGNELAE